MKLEYHTVEQITSTGVRIEEDRVTIRKFPNYQPMKELRDAVADVCAGFPLDYWDAHDRDHVFPEEFFQAAAEAGLLGITIPEEYGGGGGSIRDMVAVLEEVAAGGGALNASSSLHIPLLTPPAVLAFGTEKQKTTYLPKIASGELFVSFGVTEPTAGTDTTKIQTFAKAVDGGYVVNGSKVWNSGALRADKILLMARTSYPEKGQRRGEGITMFLTDMKVDSVEIRPIPKIGRNAVQSCEVFFRDHPIPEDDVIGTVGQGFYQLLHSLNAERLYLGSEAIGMGRWAIESGSKYANERVVFGRPIGANQAVQHPLARTYLQLLAASEVVQAALDVLDEEGLGAIGALANGAKLLATEAGFAATDAAMQVFGGYAYAREYHIGRHWTESRLLRIGPVNNELILNYISERELGLPRSY